MNLEKFRNDILAINNDIDLPTKTIFAAYFNRTIRKINIRLNTAFPTIASDFSNEATYNYFEDKWFHTIASGIIYDAILSDEGDADFYRTYFLEFENGIIEMEKYMVIPELYKNENSKLETGFLYSGLTNESTILPKKLDEVVPFFINFDLTQLYKTDQIPKTDLLILNVPFKLWKYLNHLDINQDLVIKGAKFELTVPGQILGVEYNVQYLINLLFNGIVLKQHQTAINNLIFKANTPSIIFDLVWKVL